MPGERSAKLRGMEYPPKRRRFLARRYLSITPPTQRHSGPRGEWPWGLRSRATPRCPGVAGVWGGHGVQGRQPLPANR